MERPLNRLSYLALATALLAGPATAADFMTPTADAVVVDTAFEDTGDWTGFSIGVSAGGAFNPQSPGVLEFDQDLDGDFSEPYAPPLSTAFGSNFAGSSEGGFTGGVSVGYDFQAGDFVFGGIVDVSHVDYTDTQSGFSSTPATYTEIRELNFLATARVRAGFLVTPELLAYVHGGIAGGDVSYSFFGNAGPTTATSRGDSNSVGFQVGGGLETMVAENISLGVEYAYTNLGSSDFTTRLTGPAAFNGAVGVDARGSDRDFDFHTVKGTLKYHF